MYWQRLTSPQVVVLPMVGVVVAASIWLVDSLLSWMFPMATAGPLS